MSVDHIAIDDNWLVKLGVWEKLTEAAITDEHEAVKCNRYAEALKPVFDVAGIDYGRADHATINGRTVVYEINTNPYIGRYVPDPNPLRRETQILARQRFADALDAIDTTGQGTVTINHGAGANQPRNEKPSWWRRSQLDVIRSSRVQARGAEHLRELENELEAKKSELNARGAQVKKLEAELLRKTRAFEEESKAVTSELKASGARVKRLEAELVKSKKETARLKAQLSALCTSRSWRITAPLRFVSQLVQRHVRREKDVTAANP